MIPDHVILSDVETPDRRLQDRQVALRDLHRRWVDLDQAIASVAGTPSASILMP